MSFPVWCNGWLIVDGTLVPLFQHPAFYGNTWFDHKSNYSMNVFRYLLNFVSYKLSKDLLQIVSTPDLWIVDYSVGLPGSQHDATAWQETHVAQEHTRLLVKGEWIWADSAYPL